MTLGKCRVDNLEKREYPRFLLNVQAPPGITRLPACWRLCRDRHKGHSCAVLVLQHWYAQGADVQAKLPHLATYLGHVSAVSTHYYLKLTPEIRQAASQRFHERFGPLLTPGGIA